MIITTNHQPRELLYSDEVPEKILSSQFDYQDSDDREGYGYIHYRGYWYHLDQFMRCQDNGDLAMLGFSGYASDSYYSGVLIKVLDDNRVIMASYRV